MFHRSIQVDTEKGLVWKYDMKPGLQEHLLKKAAHILASALRLIW